MNLYLIEAPWVNDFPPYTKKPGTKYVVAASQSVVLRALALYDRDWTKIEDLGEVLIIEDIRAPSGAEIVPDIDINGSYSCPKDH